MVIFEYKAYDSSGAVVNSSIESVDLDTAKSALVQQGLHLVSIKMKPSTRNGNLFTSDKLTLDELEFITSELSLLLRSGVKIDRSLHILSKGKSNSPSGKLLSELSLAVKRGESLADALSHHPHFDSLYVNLVKMGEASGELSSVFAGLARDLTFRKELKAKIVQALTYPSVILAVCILAIVFVFNFIVPQMGGLFDGNDNLPLYTQFLLNASEWMRNYQWWLLAAIVLSGIGIKYALQKGLINDWLDDTLVKLPIFKSAIYQIERIRFNTSMALMLDAGVKLDKAIELAAGTVKNSAIRQGLHAAKSKIKRGISLTEALSVSVIYPDFYVSLLEVGEESGQLSPVFEEIASRSRNDFGAWTTKITSLLEPLMILVMGGIVGSVVVVMLLSIMSVNDGF
ncbi:type II secretion system F family protein [Shewanella sp. SW36]|uniref:type II secretion system F family protein n=1 Tax=unclassified Shewanella TaxID=196818 RepID=UPI0021DA8CCC|nr:MULTISPECIES: type II secretion system F family protein [unclassified Shewanella]MCU7975905.1 type II secretion system F family protein [Shewanella sp. SW36]MCU7991295.1 type II secretion system F family protein [Shewanella sp. SW1]MCU8052532.1 type II secretion system F family protein [Shewanella sp. SM43]